MWYPLRNMNFNFIPTIATYFCFGFIVFLCIDLCVIVGDLDGGYLEVVLVGVGGVGAEEEAVDVEVFAWGAVCVYVCFRLYEEDEQEEAVREENFCLLVSCH